MRHGGKVTLCSTEGCTNNAHNEGVCKRHGAYSDTSRADIQAENNCGRGKKRNTVPATEISDVDVGETRPLVADRKGKAGENQSKKLTSTNSIGEKDEGAIEQGPITDTEKTHQQSDESSDNEANGGDALLLLVLRSTPKDTGCCGTKIIHHAQACQKHQADERE